MEINPQKQERNLVVEGLVQELPPRFQEIPGGFPDRQPDRVVKVLILTDANRIHLLDQMTETLKNGEHVGMVHVDVDWLKDLNETHSRDLGDKAIRNSVGAVAQMIDEFFPEASGVKISILRDAHAADETWFFLFGVKEEQFPLFDKLRQQVVSWPEVAIPNSSGRGISFSVGISHSGEVCYEKFLNETRERLKRGEIPRPYDFFNQIQEGASSEAHTIKGEKILAMLAKAKDAPTIKELKAKAALWLGGLRIPPEILLALMDEVEQRTREEMSHG